MRILIEEYQYNVSDVHDVLYGIDPMENVEGKVSIHYVGYYYNPLLGDCVFILPKVLLRDVDGKYQPYDIINPEGQEKLTKEERDFLYGFAVWIYRAIVVYKNDKSNDSTIVYQKMINQVGGSSKRKSNTFLDILLSLIQFNKDNKSFFFFVLKNLHSGLNKINWTRTISTTSAIIQGGDAIYLNPVNKKRKINFDEELLVIFFSILNYIGDTYGFPKEINCNFDLIKGKQFEKYRNGYGKVRLNQIKYKYFSDKALQLWKLCYAFFDKSHHIYVNTSQKEYLLVKSFHIVFEAIIDALVGDNPLPDGMDKKQEDGKIVDHIFTAKSLINDESSNTYYIGDSKYYKMGNELGKESIYKQYTYARNVIQWNLDIFNSGRKPESGIKLRDDETEGYNIIPNFFISATMDEKFRYAIDGIKETDRKNNRYISKQFQNRLFDRDTLLLFHYDVNFLFVVALYGRNGQGEKKVWRDKVRKMFRKEIQQMLNSKFDFYAVTAKEGVSGVEYIQDHFQQLLGKIFTPYDDRGTQRYYSLALDNGEQFAGENATILSQLKDSFYVVPCKLGDDPKTLLPEVAPLAEGIQVPSSFLTMHYLERYLDKTILIGCYHDEAHLNWILGKNDKGTLIYNIRVGKEREGGQIKAHLDKMVVSFVVLYEYGHEHENKYRVFHVHHHAYIKEDRMRETLYPSEPKGNYFCYVFDEEVTLGKLDVQRLISQKRIDDREYVDGAPIFMSGKELIKYRK